MSPDTHRSHDHAAAASGRVPGRRANTERIRAVTWMQSFHRLTGAECTVAENG